MAKRSSLTDEDRENLIAYLDGELDSKTAQTLETKISLDPACRQEADALRKTWAMLDYLPRPEPSATFTSRTLQFVSAARQTARAGTPGSIPWRPWILGIGWAVAAVVVGSVGFAGMSIMSHRDGPSRTLQSSAEVDELLVRDLGVIVNQRLYENVQDMTFLMQLAAPELFGDDN
jgi:anti-sigma factor RsiW